MAKSANSAFTGGKLSLKGDKKKPKKKSKTSKHHGKIDPSALASRGRSNPDDSDDEDHRAKTNNGKDNNSSDEEDLTAAEKRSRKFKKERERKELERVVRCVISNVIRCGLHKKIFSDTLAFLYFQYESP